MRSSHSVPAAGVIRKSDGHRLSSDTARPPRLLQASANGGVLEKTIAARRTPSSPAAQLGPSPLNIAPRRHRRCSRGATAHRPIARRQRGRWPGRRRRSAPRARPRPGTIAASYAAPAASSHSTSSHRSAEQKSRGVAGHLPAVRNPPIRASGALIGQAPPYGGWTCRDVLARPRRGRSRQGARFPGRLPEPALGERSCSWPAALGWSGRHAQVVPVQREDAVVGHAPFLRHNVADDASLI